MQPKTRDLALDLLKGLGCLLMIIAHAALKTGIYRQWTFLGGFAPVPFYAAVGVTAGFQAQRYPPRPVLLNYLFLFLLGFALNGFNSPDYLRPPVIHFDIIQIIALGGTAVYLLEYYFKPPAWIYLLLGAASFLIKLGLGVVLPAADFPALAGLLLPYSGTFPLFPWLFLFFLGVFAYRIRISWDLVWSLILIGVFVLLSRAGLDLDERSKYDMSVGYFLLCCILLFGLFWAARGAAVFPQASALTALGFLGRNSLLFLFVHFAALAFFGLRLQWHEQVGLFRTAPFLFWLFILLVALAAMVGLLRLARIEWLQSFFGRIWAWVLLVALIVGVAAAIPHNGLVRWAEAGLGILGALYYHRLGAALKQGPAGQAG